jgi:hypothetical protein
MRSLIWILPIVPVISAACAYAAISKRWHRAWLVTFSLLANSQILWVAALVAAYCYSRDQLLGPFASALVSSIISGSVLYISTARFRERSSLRAEEVPGENLSATTSGDKR